MLAVKRFLILLTNFTEELTDKRGNGPQADRVWDFTGFHKIVISVELITYR